MFDVNVQTSSAKKEQLMRAYAKANIATDSHQ